jgi:hypothetical protein
MNEADIQKIKDLIDEHSIEAIIEVYLQDNCYGDIVDAITTHLNKKLELLAKIEYLFKKDKE